MKYNPLYDTTAPKKAVHVSVNCDLLHKAKLNNINLSQILEERLIELLNDAQKKNWLDKNREAIHAHTKKVERDCE